MMMPLFLSNSINSNNNNNSNINNDFVEHPSSTICPPKVIPDPEVTSSLMIKELNEMSVKEREDAYDDIHGVSDYVTETPEFVQESFYKLQLSLNKIRNKPAYEMAKAQSPDYVCSSDFFLMFLRSTNFDIQQTAKKIVSYFEHKRYYFGDALLGRPILLSDLNDFDLEYLKSGWLQALPFRDKAGRVIVWIDHRVREKKNPLNCMRAMWYFSASLQEDEEFQKRGFVAVACGASGLDLSSQTREAIWHFTNYASYAPQRMMASHFCIETTGLVLQIISLANSTWGKDNRARNRVHVGSQTEWIYALLTFGVPVEYAPITNGGQIKTKYYQEWLAQRYIMEFGKPGIQPTINNNNNSSKSIILFPRRNDVLVGKGGLVQHYAGNLFFNQIVDEHKELYQYGTSRPDKMKVANEVWKLLKKENIRFIERCKSQYCWEEVHDKNVILKKIMSRLRTKIMQPPPVSSSQPNTTNQQQESQQQPSANSEDDNENNINAPSFLNHAGSQSKSGCDCKCFHSIFDGPPPGSSNKRARLATK